MNFNPFAARRDRKAAEMNLIQKQTDFVNQRTTALENLTKARDTALTAVTKMVSNPTRSLADELYSNGPNPYQSNIWGVDSSSARKLSRIANASAPSAQSMTGR